MIQQTPPLTQQIVKIETRKKNIVFLTMLDKKLNILNIIAYYLLFTSH